MNTSLHPCEEGQSGQSYLSIREELWRITLSPASLISLPQVSRTLRATIALARRTCPFPSRSFRLRALRGHLVWKAPAFPQRYRTNKAAVARVSNGLSLTQGSQMNPQQQLLTPR